MSRTVDENTELWFGNYEGRSISYVLNMNPSYLVWAIRKDIIEPTADLRIKIYDEDYRAKQKTKQQRNSQTMSYAYDYDVCSEDYFGYE